MQNYLLEFSSSQKGEGNMLLEFKSKIFRFESLQKYHCAMKKLIITYWDFIFNL